MARVSPPIGEQKRIEVTPDLTAYLEFLNDDRVDVEADDGWHWQFVIVENHAELLGVRDDGPTEHERVPDWIMDVLEAHGLEGVEK